MSTQHLEKKKKKLCYDPNPERGWRWDHVSELVIRPKICFRTSVSLSICWSSFYDISCLTFGFSAGIVWLLIQYRIYRTDFEGILHIKRPRLCAQIHRESGINNLYRHCSCLFHDFIKTTKTTMTSKMTRRLTLVWPGLKLGIQFSTWPHFTWRPGGGPLMLLWWGLMSFHGWIKNSNGSV